MPLAHEAAVGLEVVGLVRRARARLDAEGLALLGAEIGLEHQLVGHVVAVGVDQLRQHRLAPVIEHHRLGGIQPGRQLAQVREGDGDGLPSAGDRQRVLHLHGDGWWGGAGAAAGAGVTAGTGFGRVEAAGAAGRVRRPGRRRATRAGSESGSREAPGVGTAWSRSRVGGRVESAQRPLSGP